jgi:hypothetical protein
MREGQPDPSDGPRAMVQGWPTSRVVTPEELAAATMELARRARRADPNVRRRLFVPNNAALYNGAFAGFVSGCNQARTIGSATTGLVAQAVLFAQAVDTLIPTDGSLNQSKIDLLTTLVSNVFGELYPVGLTETEYAPVAEEVVALYSEAILLLSPISPPGGGPFEQIGSLIKPYDATAAFEVSGGSATGAQSTALGDSSSATNPGDFAGSGGTTGVVGGEGNNTAFSGGIAGSLAGYSFASSFGQASGTGATALSNGRAHGIGDVGVASGEAGSAAKPTVGWNFAAGEDTVATGGNSAAFGEGTSQDSFDFSCAGATAGTGSGAGLNFAAGGGVAGSATGSDCAIGPNTASGGTSAAVGGVSNSALSGSDGCFAGENNTAEGGSSTCLGGQNNTSSEENASCLGGLANAANAVNAVCLGGLSNSAGAPYSVVFGAGNRTIAGLHEGALVGGTGYGVGNAMGFALVGTVPGTAGGETVVLVNQISTLAGMTVPDNYALQVLVKAVAQAEDGAQCAEWFYRLLVKNFAGTLTIAYSSVGSTWTPEGSTGGDVGTWTLTPSVSGTTLAFTFENGSLSSASPITCSAQIDTVS